MGSRCYELLIFCQSKLAICGIINRCVFNFVCMSLYVGGMLLVVLCGCARTQPSFSFFPSLQALLRARHISEGLWIPWPDNSFNYSMVGWQMK